MRAGVEPAIQDLTTCEGRGLSGEVGEHHLSYVLREVGVPVDLAQRGRIDEGKVPPHQFGKRILGVSLRVASAQFAVGSHFTV